MSAILALQGASRDVIQNELGAFVARRLGEGRRVVGCVEVIGPSGSRAGYVLKDVVSGRQHHIEQNLGPLAEACHLDPAGIVDVCQSIIEALTRDCEVLVLAKFGKLEAYRSGLISAFARAVEQDIPVLTSVAPTYGAAWQRFAGEMAAVAPPDRAVLEAWWHRVRG
ncbi:DUF2478 domain-containing protein [Ancylobacter sp. Lp-2]|uniref:DUF2478 domain-containing protein n=1 Tax=Ancylobacter sp. Lp-2 TaxID=2881339 RepID=UPI001E643D96|nr:DUF2478 domain-containing protein [Ancylobacter sp. Lp-2]MCB4770428.1 DUF2478 domain-containing protein [Ancylobacter sp. Lp-2]